MPMPYVSATCAPLHRVLTLSAAAWIDVTGEKIDPSFADGKKFKASKELSSDRLKKMPSMSPTGTAGSAGSTTTNSVPDAVSVMRTFTCGSHPKRTLIVASPPPVAADISFSSHSSKTG